jgi:hypothetical protein
MYPVHKYRRKKMSNLRRTLVATLIIALPVVSLAPFRAAAQTGTKLYEITVTNITTSMQGLSPLVIATHPASVQTWQMGQMASKGLELLAEEGMTDMLASEWRAGATDVQTTKAHLLPGDSITVMVAANDGDVLSAATMLIQTNDGFTGLHGAAITEGDTDTMAYDAGTEENTEKKSDVPGPPFGGKNSGPATNPFQAISEHGGIKGVGDVTPEFNWSGPVARFTVRAITAPVPTGPTYDVTVTNITNSMQGLSPLVIATHPASAQSWQIGQMASKGLELLAEEGMPDMLATEWRSIATDVKTTKAHLFPGDSITVRITAREGDVLSAATMLIQTNDGFTGLHGATFSDGTSMDAMAYDAGTEQNTEKKSDVPGPPFGGKNSGPATNPFAAIAMHQGITGVGDVTPEFNWSGPVARFSVEGVSFTTEVLPETVPGGMPATGAADTTIWLVAALLAALVLVGVTLRQAAAIRR